MKYWCIAALIAVSHSALAATLVHNVTGYSMDHGELRRFAALEYDAGVITAVYPSAQAAEQSRAEQRIDGGGATLLPGLVDAHGHVTSHGRALAAVDLTAVASEADAVVRVAEFIAANPQSQWITGRGWNQVLWPGRDFPDRSTLDALDNDKPVALGRVDGHALWVNSLALELAGIGEDTADPEGGQIVRDSDGRPTGVLVDNAMTLVFSVMPAASDEEVAAFQLRALEDLAAHGITSVHDAGVSAQELRAFDQLQDAGALPARVYVMLDMLDPANDDNLAAGPRADAGEMLAVRSVKISADGALGSRGAALFEDYSDAPGHRGLLLLSPGQLQHHMDRAVAAGFQVNTHAIGDRANDRVLTEYERLNREPRSRELRHRVEHAQILRPADIARFPAAGVIASIQPTHATSDKNMAGDRLGDARLNGAYAWHTLLASGARLAGGSDFPVESVNPFFGLHAAVTRQGHDNRPPGGWLPGEKLNRAQTLSLFTEDAAYAAHQETRIGRLLPGYSADFILVRDDYFNMPEQDIWNNRVLATYVAGRPVFEASAMAND